MQLFRILVLAIALAAFACASPGKTLRGSEALDFGFRGPGRLLVIFEDGEREVALVVSDADGARRQRVERPRDARWITPTSMLVLSEEVPEEFRLPSTHMLEVELDAGPAGIRVLDGPRRHYDPEPSPGGEWLAIGVDVAGVGESDLEIWRLWGRGDAGRSGRSGESGAARQRDAVPERIASRAQTLDEPRWSPDARRLVASHPIPDPIGSDDSLGGGFGGVSFAWSRLFLLRRDLGAPTLMADGATPGHFAAGGTLPLWWSKAGIYARQRIGLVLCTTEEQRCDPVYDPGAERRVVDGRRLFVDSAAGTQPLMALLLVAHADTPRLFASEIHRVDLGTGVGEIVFRAEPETLILDIDWIGTD